MNSLCSLNLYSYLLSEQNKHLWGTFPYHSFSLSLSISPKPFSLISFLSCHSFTHFHPKNANQMARYIDDICSSTTSNLSLITGSFSSFCKNITQFCKVSLARHNGSTLLLHDFIFFFQCYIHNDREFGGNLYKWFDTRLFDLSKPNWLHLTIHIATSTNLKTAKNT